MSDDPDTPRDDIDRPREGHATTDRETIRSWAEEHSALPIHDPDESGEYRFVRESEMEETYERADWDAFFSDIEENRYAVVHRGEDAHEPFEITTEEEAMSEGGLDQQTFPEDETAATTEEPQTDRAPEIGEEEAESTGEMGADDVAETTARGMETTDETEPTTAEMGRDEVTETGALTLSKDEIGKTVVDSAGAEVGMVSDVDDTGRTMYVDTDPGITAKIKAALDWGSGDEGDYTIGVDGIRDVTRDTVELKSTEELEGRGRRR